MDGTELAKQRAAEQAIDEQLKDYKIIGIGSGSTIVYAVQRLSQLYKQGKEIKACIPSSFQSRQLIIDHGLPLATLDQFPIIDVTFDGCDEIDTQFNCIKGGGGCHLQEKILIANSRQTFIICDDRKQATTLGQNWKRGVPLEVAPMAYQCVSTKLKEMGGVPTLRMAKSKAGPVVTDNSNFIIDVDFGLIPNPLELNSKLISIVGILETGLFCNLVHGVYFGKSDGTVFSMMK